MKKDYKLLWERFVAAIAPSLPQCAELCKSLWPQDCARTLKTAGELLDNTFLFQLPWDMEQTHAPVRFAGKINWQHVQDGDEEFTFQLNRHRYWICLGQAWALTGEERYAETFAAQLMDWLASEPWRESAARTTWRTLEAGLRADYWVRAMALCAGSKVITPAVIAAFFDGLEAHAKRLAENPRVAFSAKSNWGVMEYTGLYLLGNVLDMPAYTALAAQRLRTALHTQLMDDGLQWEASPMYHNEVLMSLLEALRAARVYKQTLFDNEELDILRAAARATLYTCTPARTQPMTGDSDETDVRDVLAQAALLLGDGELKAGALPALDYESIWLYGAEGAQAYRLLKPEPLHSGLAAFPCGGQYVLRDSWEKNAFWLYFKNGPLGGGHGHQDKLHIGLWLDGEEVLADGGRYTYTDTTPRYDLKSAHAHNVPLLQDEEYAPCADSWLYQALPQALPNRVLQKGIYTYFEGAHTGYAAQGVTVVRRVVAIGTSALVINDSFIGKAPQAVSQQFHFGRSISLSPVPGAVAGMGREASFIMWFFADGCAVQPKMQRAAISRHYNLIEQTAGLCARAQGARSLTTLLVRRTAAREAVRAMPEEVYNAAYNHTLTRHQAEGYVIETGKKRYAVLLLHQEAGNSEDYNGINGVYGLGRTMACDLTEAAPQMTVLQW